MKKSIVFYILFLVSSLPTIAQTSEGKWDAESATYTNAKHGISWTLVEGMDWEGRPILTNSTLLKVRNKDAQIVVTLGATKGDTSEVDAWDYLSLYQSEKYIAMFELDAQRNNMTLNYVKPQKSQLCGRHALKIKVDMSRYYPEYDAILHSVWYQYQVVSGFFVYTLSIRILLSREEDLDDCDKLATMMFNQFAINN